MLNPFNLIELMKNLKPLLRFLIAIDEADLIVQLFRRAHNSIPCLHHDMRQCECGSPLPSSRFAESSNN